MIINRKIKIWLKFGAGLTGFVLLMIACLFGLVEWRFRRTVNAMKKAGEAMSFRELTGENPSSEVDRMQELLRVWSDRVDEKNDGESFRDRLAESLLQDHGESTDEEFAAFRKSIIDDSVWQEAYSEIDLFRAEGRMYVQEYDSDVGFVGPSHSSFLEIYSVARDLCYLLVAGDRMGEAETLILRTLDLAETVRYQPVLLTELVGNAAESMIRENIRVVLSSGGFRDPGDLRRLLDWSRERRSPAMETVLIGERVFSMEMFFSDALEENLNFVLAGDEQFPFELFARPYLKACLPLIWDTLPDLGKWLDRKPYQRQIEASSFIEDIPRWDRVSPFYLDAEGLAGRIDVHLAQFDLMETALWLEIHRRETGAYPETLSSLENDLPLDRFSGKSLIYRKEGGSYLLYSVGPDLKDNNGKTKRRRTGAYDVVWDPKPRFPWDPPGP